MSVATSAFITTAGHGTSVLNHDGIGEIVVEALRYFHGDRVLTGDLVVMPNHVHALITPLDGFELEDIMHSIKSFSANWINEKIGASGSFWQRESYDHIVRDIEQLEGFEKYIAANPIGPKLKEGDYSYVSADYHLDE